MSDKISEQFSQEEKESLKFLERDYNQCFIQMRHYDAQIFDVFKFLFSAYTGIIGVSLGLYQFGLREDKDLSLPGIALIMAGLILGLFKYIVVIRNRVYFVQVTRYINEQRGIYLKYKPLGFKNTSKMYTDPTKPPFLDWRSTQFLFSCVIALLNSGLFGVLLFIAYGFSTCVLWWSLLLLLTQLTYGVFYLVTRENKTAERAIFGVKNDNNR